MNTSEEAQGQQVAPTEETGKRQRRSSAEASTLRRMTLAEAAVEFGVDRITLRRKLVRAEHPVGDGELYTVAQIHRTLVGDLGAEKIRETSARADLLELERLEKMKALVNMEQVSEMIRKAFLPVRERLMALPNELASQVAPSDPAGARETLQRWADSALARIKGGIVG